MALPPTLAVTSVVPMSLEQQLRGTCRAGRRAEAPASLRGRFLAGHTWLFPRAPWRGQRASSAPGPPGAPHTCPPSKKRKRCPRQVLALLVPVPRSMGSTTQSRLLSQDVEPGAAGWLQGLGIPDAAGLAPALHLLLHQGCVAAQPCPGGPCGLWLLRLDCGNEVSTPSVLP